MTTRTTTLGGTDFTDGEVLYAADLNDTIEEIAVFKNIASGSITIATTTTAYNTANQYVDISIAAGDLTASSILFIDLYSQVGDYATQLQLQLEANDVTSSGNIVSNTNIYGGDANEKIGIVKFMLLQEVNDTSQINGQYIYCNAQNTISSNSTTRLDTGDDNIFTTAFTLRLNFKWADSNADQTGRVRYKVYAQT